MPFKMPQITPIIKSWLKNHDIDIEEAPLAISWLKAQGVGLVVLTGLKLFPICNPYFGFAMAATVFLTEEIARDIFRKLYNDNSHFLEYIFSLGWSTIIFHIWVYLAFPAIDNLLQLDMNYLLLRTALTITHIVGEALFQRYKSKTISD